MNYSRWLQIFVTMEIQRFVKALSAALVVLGISSPLFGASDENLADCLIALKRAEALGNRDSLAAACCNLSEYYTYVDDDSTRYFCRLGLEYSDKDKPEPYLVLKNNLAYTYTAEGDMDTALQMYREILQECNHLDYRDVGFRSSVLSSLGVVFRRMEMPDSALACYGKALDCLGEDGPADEQAYLLTNIAILYANTSRFEEAERYSRLAVSVASDCDDIDMTFYASTTAGAIFNLSGKADEASSAIHSVLSAAHTRKLPVMELKGITYLLSIFERTDAMDSVGFYQHVADSLVKLLPPESAEVQGYLETMSNIYHSMGRYRESLDLLETLEKTSGTNSQMSPSILSLRIARDYKALGRLGEATEYYERAYALADSLHSADLESSLSEFSVKYETKEKELEISRLNEARLMEKARTLRWFAVAVAAMSALVLLAISYFYRRRKRIKEEELRVARSYIEGLEKERSRLAKELHDGVSNDLLGIGLQLTSLPKGGDLGRICNLLEQTREEVRSISHELIPPKFHNVTLKDTVEAYAERFSRSSNIRIDCICENKDIEWDALPEHISYEVYRVMQELLSNVVQHSGASWICVRLMLGPDLLVLNISDDGRYACSPGTHSNSHTHTNSHICGIGLETVKERAVSIGGRYSVKSDATGQSFTFEVPFGNR